MCARLLGGGGFLAVGRAGSMVTTGQTEGSETSTKRERKRMEEISKRKSTSSTASLSSSSSPFSYAV